LIECLITINFCTLIMNLSHYAQTEIAALSVYQYLLSAFFSRDVLLLSRKVLAYTFWTTPFLLFIEMSYTIYYVVCM